MSPLASGLRRLRRWIGRSPLARRLLRGRSSASAAAPAARREARSYSWAEVPAELRALFSDTIPAAEKLHFMRLAIEEARRSPFQPAVGALIVRDGEIIARGTRDSVWVEGATRRARVRLRHAEEVALSAAAGSLEAATLYTTLEPCSGRWTRGGSKGAETCSSLIVRRGVGSVVIGLVDGDPRTLGRGVRHLVDNGVRVEHAYEGIEQTLCELVGDGRFWHAAPAEGEPG